VILGACGILDSGDPEQLVVKLTSEETQEVHVVTSMNFNLIEADSVGEGEAPPPPEVELVDADTQTVFSPWSQGYDLTQDPRFFVQLLAPDSFVALVSMDVSIDGNLLATKSLGAAGDSVDFVYVLVR